MNSAILSMKRSMAVRLPRHQWFLELFKVYWKLE